MAFKKNAPGCCSCGSACDVTVKVTTCCNHPQSGVTVTATKGAFSVSGTTDANGLVVLDISGGGTGTYSIHASSDTIDVTQSAVILDCSSIIFVHGPGLPATLFWTDDGGSATLTQVVGLLQWKGCGMITSGYGALPRSVVIQCGSDGLTATLSYPAACKQGTGFGQIIADCDHPTGHTFDLGHGTEDLDCTNFGVFGATAGFYCTCSLQSSPFTVGFPAHAHCETSIYTFSFDPNALGITSGTLSE